MRPTREVATRTGQTYFVTSNSVERKFFFRNGRWAELFIEVLYSYRPERYKIHGFVVMPDHFHVLITPREALERAVQFIKGGFSFRAKRQFGWSGDIWVVGFSDHRIRDARDLAIHQQYIANNPVKAGIARTPSDYAYSSASGRFELDEIPQGLKPLTCEREDGAAEAAPFQSSQDLDSVLTLSANLTTYRGKQANATQE